MEIQHNINALAEDNSDGFSMIIRGANHLSNDQGISNEMIFMTDGQVKADPNQNPFKESYKYIYYFNAAYPNAAQLSGNSLEDLILRAGSHYYTGKNAVQIHAGSVASNFQPNNIINDVVTAARLVETETSKKNTTTQQQNPLHHTISEYPASVQQEILRHLHNRGIQQDDSIQKISISN